MGRNHNKTHEQFIAEINAINQNYTIIDTYLNNATKLRVVDKHGIVYLMHPKHMRFGSSPSIQTAIDKRLAFEILARLKHGNKYDYSLVEYINANTKVKIICPIHGQFEQIANGHLRGRGCSRCNRFKPFTLHNFIKRSRGRNAILYLISAHNNSESFIKVGVTFKTIKDRFYGKRIFPYIYEVLDYLVDTPKKIYKLEHFIHKKLRIYHYTPLTHFGGDTECFQESSRIASIQLFKTFKQHSVAH